MKFKGNFKLNLCSAKGHCTERKKGGRVQTLQNHDTKGKYGVKPESLLTEEMWHGDELPEGAGSPCTKEERGGGHCTEKWREGHSLWGGGCYPRAAISKSPYPAEGMQPWACMTAAWRRCSTGKPLFTSDYNNRIKSQTLTLKPV